MDYELYHYGTKGMKWGVRRYQNKDGSLTPAGKKRAADYDGKMINVAQAKGRAFKADVSARRQAFKDLNASPERHTKHQYAVASIKAGVKARKESIAADKAHNKEVRKQRADEINKFKEKRNELMKSRPVGSRIATVVLAGPFANRTYNSLVTAGHTKTRAAVETALTAMLGGPVGHIAISAIVASDAADRALRS